jgi:nitrogen fixation protein NifU and related proteins
VTSELRELYQETILDHSRQPRNFGALPGANRTAEGYNPLCGDRAKIDLAVDGEVIKDIRFQGAGCSIFTASASMMTESVKGKTRPQAEALFTRFHDLITGDPRQASRRAVPELGKLAVFAGVSEFPVRVKCAALAWHTLKAAMAGDSTPVSTEVSESSSGDGGGRAL